MLKINIIIDIDLVKNPSEKKDFKIIVKQMMIV